MFCRRDRVKQEETKDGGEVKILRDGRETSQRLNAQAVERKEPTTPQPPQTPTPSPIMEVPPQVIINLTVITLLFLIN